MNTPPKISLGVLRFFCPKHRIEEIEGDLYEEFIENIELIGISKARRIYTWTVFRSFKSYLIISTNPHQKQKPIDMITYQIKMAFRNFAKNKTYTAINILGLVVGLASSIAIALFVIDNQSMDTFLLDSHEIYRLESESMKEGKISRSVSLHKSLLPAIAQHIPEIVAYTRLSLTDRTVIMDENDSRKIIEERFLFADKDFFKIFSYDLIAGDLINALSESNKIILTVSTAKRYFKDDNPIGRFIKLNDGNNSVLEVAGVVEDPKGNSSLQFDILAPISQAFGENEKIGFGGNFFRSIPVYVRLAPGTNAESVNQKVVPALKTYTEKASLIDLEYSFKSFENLKADIEIDDDLIAPTDNRVIVMFMIVASLIIALAIINYINLTTARALQRSHEVGIRKVVGAHRGSLVRQFLIESLLFCFIALPIALLLVELTLPYFEMILGRKLFFNYKTSPEFFGVLILALTSIGLLAGIYPSLVLSQFNFAEFLKGKLANSNKSNWLRKALVIFQFTFSIALIIGAVLVQNQLAFIKKQTLSYNPEQVIVISGGFGKFRTNYKSLKQEMGKVPGVIKTSASRAAPGDDFFSRSTHPDVPVSMTQYIVDENFFDLFNIEIVKGKNFNSESDSIKTHVIFNEALAQVFEGEDPIKIDHISFFGGSPNKVIGVVKNFHFESLHNTIKPAIFISSEASPWALSKIIVKIESEEFLSVVSGLEEVWESFYPDDLFQYEFLDNRLQNKYSSEQKISGIFNLFTVLSIFISCLGLLGLSTYTAQVKMKEISIRKVLGANVKQIFTLLTGQIYLLILFASVLAVPIAYYFVQEWLNDFAYKVAISPMIIGLTILMAFLIAGLTMSFKVISAAMTNPVDSLRNE